MDNECLLFPSKENRDWSQFYVPQYKVGDHFIWKKDMSLLTYVGKRGGNLILRELTEQGKEHYINKDEVTFVEKFDGKFLKPFDKVLVKRGYHDWTCAIFSHSYKDDRERYRRFYTSWKEDTFHCVPYNEETKHLVGTDEVEPEFYNPNIKNEDDNTFFK
jgi:ASC-1-like (ASCH) protein